MDRDTKFGESFRRILNREGIEPVRLPPQSPNLNAHLERFFGSLKSECLDRMIFFGEGSLRNAVREFVTVHGSRHLDGVQGLESPQRHKGHGAVTDNVGAG
jgi:transposase InsO family protein